VKQSATDPQTGRIDLGMITTGQSSATRQRRHDMAKALKAILEKKGKVVTHRYEKILEEFKSQSDIQITREMFEDALKDLSDERYLTRTNQSIKLNVTFATA